MDDVPLSQNTFEVPMLTAAAVLPLSLVSLWGSGTVGEMVYFSFLSVSIVSLALAGWTAGNNLITSCLGIAVAVVGGGWLLIRVVERQGEGYYVWYLSFLALMAVGAWMGSRLSSKTPPGKFLGPALGGMVAGLILQGLTILHFHGAGDGVFWLNFDDSLLTYIDGEGVWGVAIVNSVPGLIIGLVGALWLSRERTDGGEGKEGTAGEQRLALGGLAGLVFGGLAVNFTYGLTTRGGLVLGAVTGIVLTVLFSDVKTKDEPGQPSWKQVLIGRAVFGGIIGGALSGLIYHSYYGIFMEWGMVIRLLNGVMLGGALGATWAVVVITPEVGKIESRREVGETRVLMALLGMAGGAWVGTNLVFIVPYPLAVTLLISLLGGYLGLIVGRGEDDLSPSSGVAKWGRMPILLVVGLVQVIAKALNQTVWVFVAVAIWVAAMIWLLMVNFEYRWDVSEYTYRYSQWLGYAVAGVALAAIDWWVKPKGSEVEVN